MTFYGHFIVIMSLSCTDCYRDRLKLTANFHTKSVYDVLSGVISLELNQDRRCEIGLPRVLEYSSTTGVVNYTSNFLLRVLVNFYFRSQISIFGCSFLQSINNFTPIGATCRPCGAKNLTIGL